MTELSTLFATVFVQLKDADYGNLSQESVITLLDQVLGCLELVRREALFSDNEEVDDIATESLKYLTLHFFAAKLQSSIIALDQRKANLEAAKVYYQRYLGQCRSFGLLDASEVRHFDGETERPKTAEEKRNYKIEKYKREKLAKQRMQEINRLVRIAAGKEGFDLEEETRELYILTLKSFARDALDELDLLAEEMAMLNMREEMMNQKVPSSSSSALPPPAHEGISVMRTYKVGDQLMMSRETVKSSVFGFGIPPPSMTIEEFGDLQKAEAEERAKRPAEATDPSIRRYKDLVKDGEEDDDELLDQATVADRNWDNWKEDNPRGAGNKMTKRF